jgi:glycerophosphoryl diester phosphodiesterase
MVKLRIALLGAVLVGCAGSDDPDATACKPSTFLNSPPLVIAHAGGDGLGPSNTVEAVRLSMAAGADVFELDVRMTSDGELVARHDADITNGTEGTGKVSGFTLAELQAFDAGFDWKLTDGTFPLRGTGMRVPTVASVLNEFPDTLTSLEIKDRDPAAGRALCTLLTDLDRLDNVFVGSDGDVGVDAFLAECPSAITTVTDALVDEFRAVQQTGEAWCAPVQIGQPPMFDDAGKLRIDAESVAWSRAHGLATFTWTTADPDLLRQLAELGVDGVYTQRPDIAREVFDTFAEAAED